MVVNYGELSRAYVTINNVNDESRKFDVNAKAWVNETGCDNLEQGEVFENNVSIATFYYYAPTNLSVNFMCDLDRQDEILSTINEFVVACKDLGGVNTI